MKRILSLVLAMVMVLGSFSAVFAVEATPAEEAGKLLKDLEILNGVDGEGNLGLEKDLRREDAILLLSRLMGEVEVANEFPVGDDFPFEDVKNPDYQGPIAWAYANKFTDGKSATKFGFNDPLTAQQYATFLLRALGYDVTGEGYTNALETAKELGLLANVEVENGTTVKRGVMAVMSVNALYTNSKDSTVTLGEKLGLELPVVEVPAPAALEVKEVVADNLKSFTVVFNQAVKSATVAAKDTAKIAVEVELAEDGMSAVGYYSAISNVAQSTSVEFTINAETAEGLKLEDHKVTKVVTDTTIPTILSATALNPKQIEILFSEPVNLNEPNVKLLSDIKLEGTAVVAEASINYTNNKVLLTLLAPMTEGTKKLEVAKVKDFANFVAPTATFDLAVIKDETAPEAISAEVKNNKEIVVTFNEPLSKLSLGEFWVDNTKVDGPKVNAVADTNYTQVKLELNSALSIGATVEVKVGYKGQKDIMGNEVKETKYITTKVADDTTLPTVEFTKVETGNKVTLTFSKPMATEGKYEVLDKDGKVYRAEKDIDGTFNDAKTVLTFGGALLGLDTVDPANYSIKLIGMKDASIRSNPLATTTLTFTSIDTKAPTVDAIAKVVTPANVIGGTGVDKDKYAHEVTIYFSEAMDKETIENLANYMAGSPLHIVPEYRKAVASADNKSVTLTYVAAAAPLGSIKVLKAVKDAAGNKLVDRTTDGNNTIVTLTTETASNLLLTITSAELTAVNKIKVTFNTNIATVYPSLFTIDGENNYFTSATISGKTVTFTTAVDLANGKDYTLKVVDPSLITNKFNKNLNLAKDDITTKAYDKVAPTVKVEHVDTKVVKFTFSEDVKITSASFNVELKVKNANGTVTALTAAAVYKDEVKSENLVGGAVYAKVFIVYLDTDVEGLEIGFPINTNGIVDKATTPNALLPTGWFEVK